MNFLGYLGLNNYNLPEVTKIHAEKSNLLMMENVRLNGYIYENYNAITDNVKDPEERKRMCNCLYRWGSVTGFMVILYLPVSSILVAFSDNR